MAGPNALQPTSMC